MRTGTGGVVIHKLYRIAIDGSLIEDVSDVLISGEASWDFERDGSTKMTCRLDLQSPSRIEPLADIVQPVVQVDFDDGSTMEEPLGAFLLDIPDETHYPWLSRVSATGRDLTWMMMNSVLEDPFDIDVGDNFGTKIAELMTGSGLSMIDVRATTRTAAIARTYWPGTTRYDAALDICQSIGWYAPFMERSGRVRVLPYRNFATIEPYATLTDDDIDLDAIVRDPIIEGLANVVAVIKDVPEAAPIVAIVKNNDPNSAISVVNLNGQRIYKRVEDATVETQADAKALAQQLLSDASQLSYNINIKVRPDFLPESHRTVDLDNVVSAGADHSGRYHVRGWRFPIEDGSAKVELTLGQAIDLRTEDE